MRKRLNRAIHGYLGTLIGPPEVVSSLFVYGLGLNAFWEFAQAGPLYDMWAEVGLGWGAFHIMVAIFGDALLVVGLTWAVAKLCRSDQLLPTSTGQWFLLFLLGCVAGIFLEWLARMMGFWTYNELMPLLSVSGKTVGLSPVLQITFLPAISAFAARFMPLRFMMEDSPSDLHGKRARRGLDKRGQDNI